MKLSDTHFQIPEFYLYRNRKVQSLEFFRELKFLSRNSRAKKPIIKIKVSITRFNIWTDMNDKRFGELWLGHEKIF